MAARFFAVAFLTGATLVNAAPFAQDIAIYDRALAEMNAAKTDSTKFGDVSIRRAQAESFRAALVRQQNSKGPQPDFVTPSGTTFIWPGGNVYYRFDPTQTSGSPATITSAKMQQFRDSVGEWAAFAKLNFIEFTGTPPNPNYITVSESTTIGEGGNSDSVGMKGGEQHVQFSPNAWNRGTICHEVGHALGLWHEQQRPDRDTYVTIDTNNISAGNQPNFAIVPGGVTHGAYDFYSVMHYSRNALAIDPNQDTITMKAGYTQFANIIGKVWDRTLSKLDRVGMAEVYGSPTIAPSATVTNTKDSGAGSLRTAVYFAFDRSTDTPPTPTMVVFHIPTSDANYNSNTGVFTIQPTFQMVAPGAGTTIDGST